MREKNVRQEAPVDFGVDIEKLYQMVYTTLVVVNSFPTEYKQSRTEYMGNNKTTRKPYALMILLVVTRETREHFYRVSFKLVKLPFVYIKKVTLTLS